MKILRDKLEKFIIKRVLVCLALLVLLDVIFLDERLMVLAGLILGSILGSIRFMSSASALRRVLDFGPDNRTKPSPGLNMAIKFLAAQTFIIIILAVTLLLNIWLFAGCTAGLLLVPLVIFINGLAEGFGITNNKFD